MINGKTRDVPIDPHMLEPVQIMVLSELGIGDVYYQPGDTLTVSRSRGTYLVWLQKAAWL